MLNRSKFTWFGMLMMVMLFVVGCVSSVSAAGDTNANANPNAQLSQEVQLLQKLNQLNLTNEQIDKMLPILKDISKTYTDSQNEVTKILTQQKDLLLKRKAQEAQALSEQIKAIREKASLKIKSAMVDLQLIFTPDQKQKLAKFDANLRPGMAMMMQKDGKVPADALKKILENRQARLKELNDKLATAKGDDKDKLQKEIKALNEQIAQLKDGKMPEGMGKMMVQATGQAKGNMMMQGKGNMMMQGKQGMMKQVKPGMMKKMMANGQMNGKMNANMNGKMDGKNVKVMQKQMLQKRGHVSPFERVKNLPTLIKALEQLRAGK